MRNLERELNKIARKAVTKIVKKETDKVIVARDNLEEFPGRSALPLWLCRERGPDRRCHRSGLDTGRRRVVADRSAALGWQGPDENDG